MVFHKSSQNLSLDGEDVLLSVPVGPEATGSEADELDLRMPLEHFDHLVVEEEPEEDFEASSLEFSDEPTDELLPGDVLVQVTEGPKEFNLSLQKVPGAEDQSDIVDEPELSVEEDTNELVVESDPWKWNTKNFLPWLSEKMQNVPTHNGRETAGLERAISYLDRLNKEISRAVRSDIKNELDVSKCEKARDEIHNGIKRLKERLTKINDSKYSDPKKKKKAGEESYQLVKEAGTPRIVGISVTVPLFISSIARTCINSMVSGGKDIEDVFEKLAKKFDLTKREQLELVQLLDDMGYAMYRPRGYLLDEDIYSHDSELLDGNTRYPG